MDEGFLKRIVIGLLVGIFVLLITPIPMYRAESFVCKVCREAGSSCVCPDEGWYWLPPFVMQMYQVVTYDSGGVSEEIILDPRGDLVVNENILVLPAAEGEEEIVSEAFESNPRGENGEIPDD